MLLNTEPTRALMFSPVLYTFLTRYVYTGFLLNWRITITVKTYCESKNMFVIVVQVLYINEVLFYNVTKERKWK